MEDGLSYSLHLGTDRNKKAKARQDAKLNPSGTSSHSNNAIQNSKQLGKANHHNLRKYDNRLELINTIKGSNDIVNDVKELYLDLFEDAKINTTKNKLVMIEKSKITLIKLVKILNTILLVKLLLNSVIWNIGKQKLKKKN